MKIKLSLVVLIFVFFSAFVFMQSALSEELTITTYYPSPYGSYHELRSQRMAIGAAYINSGAYCWEGVCTNTIDANASLIVDGNVGIGTSIPKNKLDIAGGLVVGSGAAYAGALTAPTNGAIIQGNVGIGKTNPATALDVTGTINATTGYQSNGTAGYNGTIYARKKDDSGLCSFTVTNGIITSAGTCT
ncbi:MAG: hypothetical protein WC417_02535 [Candidatus Omnitrophota bacterium]